MPDRPRSESLEIPLLGGPVPALGALLDRPRGAPAAAVLLAHGAGASMDSDFLSELAQGLAARGLAVLRFEYPYMRRAREDGRRRPPDRAPVLMDAHRAALAFLRGRAGEVPLILAGKSMGGRVASHLAAQGERCAGCAILGYPLHPAGRPERAAERCAHFGELAVPTLFVQGTRDPLAPLSDLRARLASLAGPCRLHVVEGADHDFALPRGAQAPPGGVREALAHLLADWIAELGAH